MFGNFIHSMSSACIRKWRLIPLLMVILIHFFFFFCLFDLKSSGKEVTMKLTLNRLGSFINGSFVIATDGIFHVKQDERYEMPKGCRDSYCGGRGFPGVRPFAFLSVMKYNGQNELWPCHKKTNFSVQVDYIYINRKHKTKALIKQFCLSRILMQYND